MFRRPFKTSHRNPTKRSDVKKLKQLIRTSFPLAFEGDGKKECDEFELLDRLFPKGCEVTVAKLSGGSRTLLYYVDSVPMFIDREGRADLYPTVHSPVMKFLYKGADLMFPGIVEMDPVASEPGGAPVSMTSERLPPFLKGEKRQITLHPCNSSTDVSECGAVGVGHMCVNWGEINRRADGVPAGKGLEVVHVFRDHLWAQGPKSQPPIAAIMKERAAEEARREAEGESAVGDEEVAGGADVDDDAGDEADAEGVGQEGDGDAAVPSTNGHASTSEDSAAVEIIEGNDDDGADDRGERGEEGDDGEADGATDTAVESCGSDEQAQAAPEISQEEMDEMMRRCFLQALKTKLCSTADGKKAKAGSALVLEKDLLPLGGSAFYSGYMLPVRPCALEMKGTSHRKLARFLKAMQQEGFVEVKEFRRGEPSIISVNVNHPLLTEFEPYRVRKIVQEPKAEDAMPSEGRADDDDEDSQFKPVKINIIELYRAPPRLQPLFARIGDSKDQLYTMKEATAALWRYVEEENLTCEDGSMVNLDEVLKKGIFPGIKGVSSTASKKEIATSLPSKMKPFYAIAREGAEEEVRKGSVGKIRITVQSRGGKKFVTCIHSVERFGIDPDNLSRLLRSKFAASCSVTSQFVSNAVGEEKVIQVNGDRAKDALSFLQKHFGLGAKYLVVESKVKANKPKPKRGRR